MNGSNRTFSAEGSGTFYFTYDKRYTKTSFSLYSKPDIGYKLQGVYLSLIHIWKRHLRSPSLRESRRYR